MPVSMPVLLNLQFLHCLCDVRLRDDAYRSNTLRVLQPPIFIILLALACGLAVSLRAAHLARRASATPLSEGWTYLAPPSCAGLLYPGLLFRDFSRLRGCLQLLLGARYLRALRL